jgi:hypothetical protein
MDRQVPADLLEQKYIHAVETELKDRILRHVRTAAVLAARLRSSVQAAVDRRSRRLEEKAPAVARSLACGWASRLLTGGVTLSPRAQDVGGSIEEFLGVPEGKHVGRKVKLGG